MSIVLNCRARLRICAALPLAAVAAFIISGVSVALAKGASYEVLYSFRGEPNDGSEPWPNLIEDKSGNLYGTTNGGGASDYGSVFKITTSGVETVLYSFTGGKDGEWPDTSLLKDSTGNLYGTCYYGGSSTSWGTVFKLAPDGTETTLYAFTGGQDGAIPYGTLIADDKGNLYGTTRYGGSRGGFRGDGTVFEIAPDGAMKLLYTFAAGNGGVRPTAGLLELGGNLFGTASGGGAHGAGTVFELAKGTKGGYAETVLYSFKSASGKQPDAALISDGAGNLYGTTALGGASGDGVVFKLAPDGKETVLHSFAGGSDGSEPITALLADRKGNLYGTTTQGGSANFGTVFKVAPDGTETVLHAFGGPRDDGASPTGSLIADESYLYGTTQVGGAQLDGTVFRIKK